ncbi:MAG: hypothetical protein KGQ49_04785, partial [Verrucomicrobia bacterium]|nr:hypothetical protein [Verrucomicrobiota bacterium]
ILMDARSGGIYAWLGERALLLPRTDPRLEGLSLCTSAPDPTHLAHLIWGQFTEEGAPPFHLDYGIAP